MSRSLKGTRIWRTVHEDGLTEIYEVASQMPVLEGNRVVWHACSPSPEFATMCKKFVQIKDPQRLVNSATYVCERCRLAYGASDWDENILQTLAKITELADRFNIYSIRH